MNHTQKAQMYTSFQINLVNWTKISILYTNVVFLSCSAQNMQTRLLMITFGDFLHCLKINQL